MFVRVSWSAFFQRGWELALENHIGPVAAHALYGVHPHFADQLDAVQKFVLVKLLQRPNVVGLGEIGLDYSEKNSVNRMVQRRTFEVQLRMALERNMPVCLHIRDATEDGFQVLQDVRNLDVEKSRKLCNQSHQLF